MMMWFLRLIMRINVQINYIYRGISAAHWQMEKARQLFFRI